MLKTKLYSEEFLKTLKEQIGFDFDQINNVALNKEDKNFAFILEHQQGILNLKIILAPYFRSLWYDFIRRFLALETKCTSYSLVKNMMCI